MKNLKDKLITESSTSTWDFNKEQMIILFAGLNAIYNDYDNIPKKLDIDQDVLNELMEDFGDEMDELVGSKKKEEIIKLYFKQGCK